MGQETVKKDPMQRTVMGLPAAAFKEPELAYSSGTFTFVLSSLCINLLALALPILILQVYDRILVSENAGTLYVLAAGVCVIVIIEGVLRLMRSYLIHWAGAVYEHTILSNSLRHLLSADLADVENMSSAEQLQRLGGVGKLKEFYSGQALVALLDLPFVFVFIGLIWYLAGDLVYVPLTLLAVFAVLAWLLGRDLKKRLAVRDEIDERKTGSIIEALNGIHTIKAMGAERLFQRRYEMLQDDSSKANYYVAKGNNTASNYGHLFTHAMIVGVMGFGTPMAMEGALTLGTLIACVLLSGRIMRPIQKTLGIWARYQDYQLAKKSVRKNFDMPIPTRLENAEFGEREGRLDIKNLTFSYGQSERKIFNDLNLKLTRGQCIAISGDNSSGKTSLLKLIAGLYQPTSGEVLVNGVPAYQYPAHELVQNVGYMAMEGMIFNGTIRDNISAFGEISDERVKEIMRLLDMDKEIAKLPLGMETQLEGRTADPVPPGLKQRITIARALALKPRILLFDNADRSLDKAGYNQVYRLLGRIKGKATMIIVSDDYNIMRLADRDYILQDGKLVESKVFGKQVHEVLPYQELRL